MAQPSTHYATSNVKVLIASWKPFAEPEVLANHRPEERSIPQSSGAMNSGAQNIPQQPVIVVTPQQPVTSSGSQTRRRDPPLTKQMEIAGRDPGEPGFLQSRDEWLDRACSRGLTEDKASNIWVDVQHKRVISMSRGEVSKHTRIKRYGTISNPDRALDPLSNEGWLAYVTRVTGGSFGDKRTNLDDARNRYSQMIISRGLKRVPS
jgi:hypothetical protein